MPDDRTLTSDATVVTATAECATILVEDLLLGDRHAASVRCAIVDDVPSTGIETSRYTDYQRGVAIGLDDDTGVIVLTTPAIDSWHTGDRLRVRYQIQPDSTGESFRQATGRLKRLLSQDTITLDDRASRHALLFVLEAHDPALRAQRLTLLQQSLHLISREPSFDSPQAEGNDNDPDPRPAEVI